MLWPPSSTYTNKQIPCEGGSSDKSVTLTSKLGKLNKKKIKSQPPPAPQKNPKSKFSDTKFKLEDIALEPSGSLIDLKSKLDLQVNFVLLLFPQENAL